MSLDESSSDDVKIDINPDVLQQMKNKDWWFLSFKFPCKNYFNKICYKFEKIAYAGYDVNYTISKNVCNIFGSCWHVMYAYPYIIDDYYENAHLFPVIEWHPLVNPLKCKKYHPYFETYDDDEEDMKVVDNILSNYSLKSYLNEPQLQLYLTCKSIKEK
jgi:hypothetical protein